MEHIAAVLLLIGCSGASTTDCRELPAPTSIYETVEECQGDLAPSKAGFTAFRGKVFAACVSVDPAMEEEDAELVWDITKDGKLVASVEPVQVMVASNRHGKDSASQE